MTERKAWCERHGPFDPIHESCPYCAVERGSIERKAKTGPLVGIDDEPSTFGGPGIEPVTSQVQEMQVWHPEEATSADFDAGMGGGSRSLADTPTLMETAPVPDDLYAYAGNEGEGDTDVDQTPGPLPLLLLARPLDRRGEVFLVKPGATVGRGHCDLRFDDRKMSRRHARIDLDSDPNTGDITLTLFDFGSSNGTYVNGQRIEGRVLLEENDEVRIGQHLFVVKLLA